MRMNREKTAQTLDLTLFVFLVVLAGVLGAKNERAKALCCSYVVHLRTEE